MQKLPELQDVASDQQAAAPHIVDHGRSRRRVAAWPVGQPDRPDVVRRFRAAPDRDDLYRHQPVQGRAGSGAAVPQRSQRAVEDLRGGTHRRPGTAERVRPLHLKRSSRCRSATRASSRRSRCRSTWRRAMSLGQAVDSIQALSNQLNVPPTLNTSFQGTAQAFQASLSSMPLLVAAAMLVVYIVLGVLYESYIHPITILSALPSAGVGALIMLMLFHYEPDGDRDHRHDPADRHREEERDHDDRLRVAGGADGGQVPAEAIHRGLPAALPPDHDDDVLRAVRRHADRARPRRGFRTAPAARYRDRRRTAGVAMADAIHDAGDLSVPGTASAAGSEVRIGVRRA